MGITNCSVQESPFRKTYGVWTTYGCNPDTVIIFPNRRSCRYFRQELQKHQNITFPKIYSVTDLFVCDVKIAEIVNILATKDSTIPLRTICDLSEEIANTIQEIVLNKVDYKVMYEKIPHLLQPYWEKIDDILQSVDAIIAKLTESLKSQISRANFIVSKHKIIAVELGLANRCIADFFKLIAQNPDNTILLLSLEAPINHKVKLPLLREEYPHSELSHIAQNRIEYAVFQTINDEIKGVAFAIRRALLKKQSVLVVAQSQDFIYRLKIELMRWNITPDSYLGTPLRETSNGKLLILAAEVLRNNFDCNSMINLLKQRKDIINAIYEFEIYRRNLTIAPRSFIDCYAKYKDKNSNVQNILDAISIEDLSKKRSLKEWLDMCYSLLKIIFENFENPLQQTDFYQFLSADLTMSADEFVSFLNDEVLMKSEQQVNEDTSKVAIVGIIEAQLLSSDLIILANANSNNLTTYDNNTILTKSMRKDFGIPTSEQQNNFIAFIFERLMNQPNVLVTRAVRVEEDLQTEYPLLQNFHMEPSDVPELLLSFVQNIPTIEKAKRFSPTPNILPEKLSASSIDLLINNPYAFYVKNILKLREIPPLFSPSIKGNFIHEILHRFIQNKLYSADALWVKVEKIMHENKLQISDIGLCYFQLSTLFDFLLENFDSSKKYYSEISGKFRMQLNEKDEIILACRADCLEMDTEGNCVIIDYKTHTPPSVRDVEFLKNLQLPFEAIIAIHGGFGIKITNVTSLQYWQINNVIKIEEVLSKEKIRMVCEATENLIKKSLYTSRSYELKLSDKNKYNDCYRHLARYQEWIND